MRMGSQKGRYRVQERGGWRRSVLEGLLAGVGSVWDSVCGPSWEVISRNGEENLAQLWRGWQDWRDKDQGEYGLSTRNWAHVCTLGNAKGRHGEWEGVAYSG